MKVERAFDAAFLNSIINHPSVHPHVAEPGQDVLDLGPTVADPRNILLTGEHGCELFVWQEPGIYEVHSQCLPEGRGAWMLDFVRECLRWMFLRTDCMELLTKVPSGNVAALALTRAIGGTLEFERQRAWPTPDGLVPMKYFALRYPEWVKRADGLIDRGHWFHERLASEKIRLGSTHEIHDDDPAHDRHVGAAVEMILAGNVAKAVVLYNRWARFAGYVAIAIAALNPTVIDIQEALLKVGDDNFEVLLCR